MYPYQDMYPPDIFITYANTPLQKNPEGLSKIVEAIPELPYQLSTIKGNIDKIIELRNRKGRRDKAKKINCSCAFSSDRKRIFNPEGLTCVECDRQNFICILNEITSVRKFSDIERFDTLFMFGGFHCFEDGKETHYHFSIEKERIKFDTAFSFASDETEEETYKESWDGLDHFPIFFTDAVAKSLLFFLAHNDRRKLKKCGLCGKYYIAKRIIENQKYCPECSPKNKMSKKEFNLYMQTYRKKGQAKKEQMRAGQYEAQILRYMKDLDLTRDEAEKLVEEEKTM